MPGLEHFVTMPGYTVKPDCTAEIQMPLLSLSPEGVNIQYFYNEYMPDVFNCSKNILQTSTHTVDLHGHCMNSVRGNEYNNVKGFVSAASFENYRNSFNTSSNEAGYRFSGYIMYGEDEFRRVRRSLHGKGENVQYKINENVGKDCYIPTAGNYFIKCYLHQEKKKMQGMSLDKIIKHFSIELCSEPRASNFKWVPRTCQCHHG
jgi:hypothetical protein